MIRSYQGKTPVIHEDAFIAETAVLIGDVTVKAGASIWYGAVLRGDEGAIVVEENANVQDNATVHTAMHLPCVIGKNVTVGHNAIVHGCTVGENSMVGMGSVILNGAQVGADCLIGAGALVKEGAQIPDGSLVVGVPAKVLRELTEEQKQHIRENGEMYAALAEEYKK